MITAYVITTVSILWLNTTKKNGDIFDSNFMWTLTMEIDADRTGLSSTFSALNPELFWIMFQIQQKTDSVVVFFKQLTVNMCQF